MKKITRATFKSFIKKNNDKLYCKKNSSFDGMTDCVEQLEETFKKPDRTEWAQRNESNTLGIRQIWLVGRGGDWFTHYEDDQFIGIKYSNCCGSGVVAIKK